MLKQVVPVVIDTNILVPSLYRRTRIFDFILNGNLVLVWNEFIYNEAVEIIKRMGPNYQKRIGISPDEVIDLLDLIYDANEKVAEMPSDWPAVSPDRDDDPFLFAAETGKAEYIISADYRHMLKLGNHNGIPIGKPNEFFYWAKINRPL